MAKNKFFYNSIYRGDAPTPTVDRVTFTSTNTVTGNAGADLEVSITGINRIAGETVYWNITGANESDFTDNKGLANSVVLDGNAQATITKTLDNVNSATGEFNFTLRTGSPNTWSQALHTTANVTIGTTPGIVFSGFDSSGTNSGANVYVYETSGDIIVDSLTAYPGIGFVEVLLVGGGGARGLFMRSNAVGIIDNVGSQGGGGAGEFVQSNTTITSTGTVTTATIGSGGTPSAVQFADGDDTTAFGITAKGGGGGGRSWPLVGTLNPDNITLSQLGYFTGNIHGRPGGSSGGAASEVIVIPIYTRPTDYANTANIWAEDTNGILSPGLGSLNAWSGMIGEVKSNTAVSGLGNDGGQAGGAAYSNLDGSSLGAYDSIFEIKSRTIGPDRLYANLAMWSLGGGGGGGANTSGSAPNVNWRTDQRGGAGGDGYTTTIWTTDGSSQSYAGGGGGGGMTRTRGDYFDMISATFSGPSGIGYNGPGGGGGGNSTAGGNAQDGIVVVRAPSTYKILQV